MSDWLHNLPVLWMSLLVFGFTYLVTAAIYVAVSVFAARAMIADALSTTLYVTPPQRGAAVLASFPGVSALATLPDGSVQHLPAAG